MSIFDRNENSSRQVEAVLGTGSAHKMTISNVLNRQNKKKNYHKVLAKHISHKSLSVCYPE